MFSKIDKKVLTISIVCFFVILLVGIFSYKNLMAPGLEIQNSLGGVQTELQDNNSNSETSAENTSGNQQPSIQSSVQSIEAESGGGTLTMCLDQCGDGICQISDPNCERGDMNCICIESHQDCPQDCK